MTKYKVVVLFLMTSLLFSCAQKKNISENQEQKKTVEKKYSYLALGDSYTVGESVETENTFPYLLSTAANQKDILLNKPKIIAKTGWRTDELLNAMNSYLESGQQYDLISILIGVNNQYQGKDVAVFKKELALIIEKAISLSATGAKGVFAFSIPDYSVTPFMEGKDTEKTAGELKEYNQEYQDVCKTFGVKFYDITRISQEAINDRSLVAKDGLHPSGRMYKLWVSKYIEEIIENNIRE